MDDKWFPDIGRIQRAAGTDHLDTYYAILAMLDSRYRRGQPTVLEPIRDGGLSLIRAFALQDRGELSGDTDRNRLKLFDAEFPGITISDLPRSLKNLRDTCVIRKTGCVGRDMTRTMFQGCLGNPAAWPRSPGHEGVEARPTLSGKVAQDRPLPVRDF